MNLFGRHDVAPNLGKRGRNSLTVLDAGPYKLQLAAQAPAAVAALPQVGQEPDTAPPSVFTDPPRTSVDPFAQPPPDWRPSLAPSPLSDASSTWVRPPAGQLDEQDVPMPPASDHAAFEPPVEARAQVDANADSESALVQFDDDVEGVTPPADGPHAAGSVSARSSTLGNGQATVDDRQTLEAPVRIIKLDPTRDVSMEVRPAALSTVADWPWRGDDNIATDTWRDLCSIAREADDASCIRTLSALAVQEMQRPACAAALRAGYAATDSPALRLSLLAALCAAPSSPLEFWWCVVGGARYPEERIIAYRAIANAGDTRGYSDALADPQPCAAVALARQLLRECGEQAFDKALAALEPDRADLLRAELTHR